VPPALVRSEAEALRVRLENAGGRVEVKRTA
jgi:hypothetical protein